MLNALPARAALIYTVTAAIAVSAQIITPQPPPLSAWDASAVQAVVREIAELTEQARLAASQQTRPGQRMQAAALADLTTLAGVARHLSSRVNEFTEGPERTQQDYLTLAGTYQRARQTALAAGYDSSVLQGLGRVEPLLNRLSLIYTSQWDHQAAGAAAEELVAALNNAHALARREAVEGDPADARAVFLLERLARAADQFSRQLKLDPGTPAVGQDLRLLIDDFARAARGIRPARFDERIEADMARAGQALARLKATCRVPWNGAGARAVADQIVATARHAAEIAVARSFDAQGPGREALRDITLFLSVAEHLARGLELWPELPARHYPDFLTLTAAYDRAAFTLSLAPFAEHVIDDFDKLGRWIAQLERMYAGTLEDPPPPMRISSN